MRWNEVDFSQGDLRSRLAGHKNADERGSSSANCNVLDYYNFFNKREEAKPVYTKNAIMQLSATLRMRPQPHDSRRHGFVCNNAGERRIPKLQRLALFIKVVVLVIDTFNARSRMR